MSLDYAKSLVRDVPDFPKPGILFKDLTPVIADPRALQALVDRMALPFVGEKIDQVLGVEARGFLFAGAIAVRLSAGLLPARKAGKLPAATERITYGTEYSSDVLELHTGIFAEGARVLVVDDVLATGGTARAAADLVRKLGGQVVAYAFGIELSFLDGRSKLDVTRVESALVY